MPLETTPFDPAEYLLNEESRLEYLRQGFASGDPAEIIEALGTVARAIGISRVAGVVGLAQPGLYRALPKDHPTLATVIRVLAAMGLRLTVERAEAEKAPAT
jgi:probable addiction module antidote protein